MYHAVPTVALENPVYRQEFLYRYDVAAVQHVLDNSDIIMEEYARPKAN